MRIHYTIQLGSSEISRPIEGNYRYYLHFNLLDTKRAKRQLLIKVAYEIRLGMGFRLEMVSW